MKLLSKGGGIFMKLLKKLSMLFLMIACLFVGACGGSTPKSVNAEAKCDAVVASVMTMLQEELSVGETQTIKITKISYVEITNEKVVGTLNGNVYYELTYAVVENELFKETGFAYAYYDADEDGVFSVGIKSFYAKSYNDYYSLVKTGSTEGVIGTIDVNK